jgi:hypothetical protein
MPRVSLPDGSVVDVDEAALAPPLAPLEITPDSISRVRFLRACVAANVLTRAEALTAARARTLPPAWETVAAALTAGEAFRMRMLWCDETLPRRSPFWLALIAGGIFTGPQLRQIFRDAAEAAE